METRALTQVVDRILAEKGMSRSEVSLDAGYTKDWLTITLRRDRIMPKTIHKIAVALGVSVSYLYEQVQLLAA